MLTWTHVPDKIPEVQSQGTTTIYNVSCFTEGSLLVSTLCQVIICTVKGQEGKGTGIEEPVKTHVLNQIFDLEGLAHTLKVSVKSP